MTYDHLITLSLCCAFSLAVFISSTAYGQFAESTAALLLTMFYWVETISEARYLYQAAHSEPVQ